jgi:hypothetical protein
MNVQHAPSGRRRPAVVAGLSVVAGLAVVAVLLAGCSSLGPGSEEATDATTRFFESLAEGDGTAACALLNESAREAVEEQTDARCADGVLTLGLDPDARPDGTEVYSRAAFVRTGPTAVFLTPGDDGWLIRAAGCEPVADAPFDCVLDGS